MWHKPCRTFHPWCLCIKTRCLSISLITSRGTDTETSGIVCILLMAPGLVWILTRTVYCYMTYFWKPDWWDVPLVLFVLTYGERGDPSWPALSRHWFFCTGCCQYLLNMKCLMYVLLFLQLSTSLGCFRPRTFFLKNGLNRLYIIFTHYTQDYHAAGFHATDYPYGVWGRGWTTCLLCGGPNLDLCF